MEGVHLNARARVITGVSLAAIALLLFSTSCSRGYGAGSEIDFGGLRVTVPAGYSGQVEQEVDNGATLSLDPRSADDGYLSIDWYREIDDPDIDVTFAKTESLPESVVTTVTLEAAGESFDVPFEWSSGDSCLGVVRFERAGVSYEIAGWYPKGSDEADFLSVVRELVR